MLIQITNGWSLERIPAVKAVREAYKNTVGYSLGLKEALEVIKDGKKIQIDDYNGPNLINELRNRGLTVEIFQEIQEVSLKEMVVERLFRMFLKTDNVELLNLAVEIKNNF